MHTLIDGAVQWPARLGAPAVEGYPVDNHGQRVDLTMAYVGTRAPCSSPQASRGRRTPPPTLDGFPRVVAAVRYLTAVTAGFVAPRPTRLRSLAADLPPTG